MGASVGADRKETSRLDPSVVYRKRIRRASDDIQRINQEISTRDLASGNVIAGSAALAGARVFAIKQLASTPRIARSRKIGSSRNPLPIEPSFFIGCATYIIHDVCA